MNIGKTRTETFRCNTNDAYWLERERHEYPDGREREPRVRIWEAGSGLNVGTKRNEVEIEEAALISLLTEAGYQITPPEER